MRPLYQIYSDDPDRFVLGSVQYAGIYEYYKDFKMVALKPKTPIDSTTYKLEHFLEEVIKKIGSMIIEEANQWDERPDLKEWNCLDLKIQLMKAKTNDVEDLTKRVFGDMFQLLKNQSWDLWTSLRLCNEEYSELREYVKSIISPMEPTGDKALGLMVYFFSEKLNLDDKEVREIFGGFDT